MGEGQQQYRLFLTGAFRLETLSGTRILISSKRGQALLAMLATASGGERTRSWLQTRLWGSRDYEHGRASLRREISTLRQTLAAAQCNILQADNSRAWIDLAAVTIDVRNDETFGFGEFLEGLDIAGEEAFEDWLREERGRLHFRNRHRPSRDDLRLPYYVSHPMGVRSRRRWPKALAKI
jgi:DNA-binding SARP family transcriptional activator